MFNALKTLGVIKQIVLNENVWNWIINLYSLSKIFRLEIEFIINEGNRNEVAEFEIVNKPDTHVPTFFKYTMYNFFYLNVYLNTCTVSF